MPNTLDLDDDLGGVELAKSLEQAFEIKFDDNEIKDVNTVGALFDIIVRDTAAPTDLKKCASAMAFYRLRRSLRAIQPEASLMPSTSLIDFGGNSAKRLFETLRQSTGLNTPEPAFSWFGKLGLASFAVAFLAILPIVILVDQHSISRNWGWAIALGFTLGWAMMKLDSGRLPKECGTFGELANQVSILSYGQLIKLGARADEDALWSTFVELLCAQSQLPKGEVRRDTVFFRNQLKTA